MNRDEITLVQFSTFKVLPVLIAWFLIACASTKMEPTLNVPEDLPDICQEIDFQSDVAMRAVCGVELRSYKAYRNIPEQRLLLNPKSAKLVRKGNRVELRLEKTLPIQLPETFFNGIGFGENYRGALIKSKMDYLEFFPANSEQRIRLLRLSLPMLDGSIEQVCYSVIPATISSQRNTGYAVSLETLACADYSRLQELQGQPDP